MKVLALFVTLCLASLGCGGVRLIRQQTTVDCTVAAVAMLVNQSYDAVLAYYERHNIPMPTSVDTVVTVAAAFGVQLELRPGIPAKATGLVSIQECGAPIGHMAYIHKGRVYDPAGTITPDIEFVTGHCIEAGFFYQRVN